MLKRLLLAIALALAPFTLKAQTLEQHVFKAGVVVFAENETGKITPVCSGAAIKDEGANKYLILTAAHCVAQSDVNGRNVIRTWKYSISSQTSGAALHEAKIVTVGNLEQGKDFAILETVDRDITDILELESHAPLSFDDVISAASPEGVAKLLLRGYIIAPVESLGPLPKALVLSMPDVAPGASGAAVVCKSTGQICGIIVATEEGTGVVIAVPIEGLHEQTLRR